MLGCPLFLAHREEFSSQWGMISYPWTKNDKSVDLFGRNALYHVSSCRMRLVKTSRWWRSCLAGFERKMMLVTLSASVQPVRRRSILCEGESPLFEIRSIVAIHHQTSIATLVSGTQPFVYRINKGGNSRHSQETPRYTVRYQLEHVPRCHGVCLPCRKFRTK